MLQTEAKLTIKDIQNKLIEKWMKRNSTGSITIVQDSSKIENADKKPNDKLFTFDLSAGLKKENKSNNCRKRPQEEITNNKTKVLRFSAPDSTRLPSIYTPVKIVNRQQALQSKVNAKKKPNISCLIEKRKEDSNDLTLTNKKSNLKLKSKIISKKLPNITCRIETVKGPVNDKKNILESKGKTDITGPKVKNMTVKTSVNDTKNSSTSSCDIKLMTNNTVIQAIPSFSVPTSTVKRKTVLNSTIVTTKSALSTTKQGPTITEKSLSTEKVKEILTRKKDTNIFNELLDNYRYLVIPKSWSAAELISDKNERCIVFFNACIIKQNEIFTSLIKKSLIIDKETKIHYSAHGLPIDTNGTFLPKHLDDTKKLLSILHIFNKMSICNGFGNVPVQNRSLIRDSFCLWRHKDCKIISIKSPQCSACTEMPKVLTRSKRFSKP